MPTSTPTRAWLIRGYCGAGHSDAIPRDGDTPWCRRHHRRDGKEQSLNDTHPARFTIDDAIVIAAQAHRGQRDKGRHDLPYVTHPMRVMARFTDPELQMIAVLHDAVEDSGHLDVPVTLDTLRTAGASSRVLAGIESMTHPEGESDEDYWRRLRLNPDAVAVKNADIDDNTDEDRLALLPPAKRTTLAAKYERARRAIN